MYIAITKMQPLVIVVLLFFLRKMKRTYSIYIRPTIQGKHNEQAKPL